MGVRGLLKYLQRHPLARQRRVSLSNLAYQIKDKTKGKAAKLLCDFFSILFWLLSEFHEAKIKRKDYQPYSYIYGGDVIEYEQRFVAFVNALRHLGIEPIFFVDGARGSNETGFRAKLSTHRGRHLGKMSRVVHCNQVSKYDPTEELETYSMWFPQPLVPLHIISGGFRGSKGGASVPPFGLHLKLRSIDDELNGTPLSGYRTKKTPTMAHLRML